MNQRQRIYLDHAATSWPKSDKVLEAMDRFARHCGAAAGRGGYHSAAEADRMVAHTRRSLARLIGAADAACISLHSNGTAALNAAIHGVVRAGDHVVTCAAEHNSVLRPLRHLEMHHNVQVTIVPTDEFGQVDAGQLLDAVTDHTRLVTLIHASNVTGAVQPVAEVGSALKDRPAIFLCDAAQTFGTLPIDAPSMGIDMLAAPGHKASGGPLGTGFLYIAPPLHDQLMASVQGGTGSQSESMEMPRTMPSIMEAGNLNVPALAGWAAALEELLADGVAVRAKLAAQLAQRLHRGLAAIEHVRLISNQDVLPIASIQIEGLSPIDAALVLDAEYGVEARAGLHCAAAIHPFLGTQSEGTLRLSGGHTSSPSDIDTAIAAVTDIAVSLNPK